MWRAAMPAADFSDVTFTIGDLAGDLLGYTLGQHVTIDPTADGWGWSVMDPGGADRMALLTVVLHELGMALGFVEDDPAEPFVMTRTLTAGVQAPPLLLPIVVAQASSVHSVRLIPTLVPSRILVLRPVKLTAVGSGATWLWVRPTVHAYT